MPVPTTTPPSQPDPGASEGGLSDAQAMTALLAFGSDDVDEDTDSQTPGPKDETTETDETDDTDSEDEDFDLDDEDETDDTDSDDTDDDEDEDDTGGDDLYEVPVDGKTEKVTLEELKRDYSGRKATTKRFQEAAELRKRAEATEAEASKARTGYLEKLNRAKAVLEKLTPPQPDFEKVRRETPEKLGQVMAEWQLMQQKHDALQAEIDKTAKEQEESNQKAYESYLREQNEKVVEVLPDLKDTEKGPKLIKAIREYALEHAGLTAEDLQSPTAADHRVIQLLYKAMRFDRIVAKKQEAAAKKNKRGRTAKPGKTSASGKGQRRAGHKAREELRKTGSEKAAVEALLAYGDE